jgi:hypothetical protein
MPLKLGIPPPYGKLEAADPIDNVEGYPPPRLKLEPPPNESKFPFDSDQLISNFHFKD